MRIKKIYMILALTTAIGITASAQTTEDNDSIAPRRSKKEKKQESDRNVMLNGSDADQPRQISVGLPETYAATIFEDGMPESYNIWPDRPYFSWFGGLSNSNTSVMSLSEGAIQAGELSYIVDSHNLHSSKQFEGKMNYQINNFGRQSFDAAITGPIANGWGYKINTHQVWDPGTYTLQAANLQNRTQSYKVGLDKSFADDKGNVSLTYQYSRYTNMSSNYGPFVFVGDGSIEEYNGFKLGTDSYLAGDFYRFNYLDINTGEIKNTTWRDAATTTNHQAFLKVNYHWDNGTKLMASSKFKSGDVNMSDIKLSGIINNTGGRFYYSDGTEYTGEKVQNVWMKYSPTFVNDWMNNVVLTGNKGNHSWRMGANYWYSCSSTNEMNTVMAQEVKEDPLALYTRSSDGTLNQATSYNASAGWYRGHENTIALYGSDEWQVNPRLWMSLGLRLAYQGYAVRSYVNPTSEDTFNSRRPGWSITQAGHKEVRITGDYFNPSAAYNIRYSFMKGFGFVGEYVFTRQRNNLESYAGDRCPQDLAKNTNMVRAGLFWNNSWIQLVSQISWINKTNDTKRATFYHTMTQDAIDGSSLKQGEEDSRSLTSTYGVKTLGWTTDFVLKPFKGFTFHGLLTLQNPQYDDFNLFATFSDGVTDGMDVSGNTVTGMSKVLIELDPSYQTGKWRFGMNFRYFGKQYINKTNTLYFNGWWESFANISYALNKNVSFGLNITNLFNQRGAKGDIGAADLVTDVTPYHNYVMSGSYIRPFEVALTTSIKF